MQFKLNDTNIMITSYNSACRKYYFILFSLYLTLNKTKPKRYLHYIHNLKRI